MKNATSAPSIRPAAKLPTRAIAPLLTVRPETIRESFCRNGHYLGMRPVKLPNGRLLWDAAQVDALLAGEVIA